MSENGGDDRFHHIEYIHFMINQINETIKYGDSKHAVGMTLVVSLLLASNEFIFHKFNRPGETVTFVIGLNIACAILAVLFGFAGLFPKYIAPYFVRDRTIQNPNIFYFRDINAAGTSFLRRAIDQTFPDSHLSEAYRESGIMEIHALSVIAIRKLRMFEMFMYALFGFLVSLFWLFIQTLPR